MKFKNPIPFLIFFLLLSVTCFSQTTRSSTPGFSPRANQTFVVEDGILSARNGLFTPRYDDTTQANTFLFKDTCGNVVYLYSTNTLWYRSCSGGTKAWVEIGGGTDVESFHDLSYLNDSTVLFNRPNGTSDTLVIGGGGSSGITIGSTTVTSGTNTRVLFNNSGVVGEYAISGTGSVAMTGSPTLTGTVTIPTPFTLGATSVTSTGTQLNYLNAATGTTGIATTNIVYSTSPLFTTPRLASTSTTGYVWTATDGSGNGSFQATTGANTALSNLASVAINTSLISAADNTDDLGSGAIGWKDVYSRTLKLDGSTSGTTTLQATAVAGTTTITLPAATGTVALINASQNWSGGIITTFNGTVLSAGTFQTGASLGTSNWALIGGSTGSSAFGTTAGLLVEGAANSAVRGAMIGTSNYTIPVSHNYAHLIIGNMSVTEFSSGAHPLISSLIIRAPSVTNAAGTTTNMATLYIDAAPSGVTPTGATYIQWNKAGLSRFGGGILLDAGTTSVAPFTMTSGTNLSTAIAGSMEYNGTNLFFTRTGTTRESVITANSVNSVSPTAPNRTITVVIDGTTYYISAKTTND